MLKIDGERITVDGNHELSGKTLHFDIEVTDVREATLDEVVSGESAEG